MTIKGGRPCSYRSIDSKRSADDSQSHGVYRVTRWRHRSSCCLPPDDSESDSTTRRNRPSSIRKTTTNCGVESSFSDTDYVIKVSKMPVETLLSGHLKPSFSLSALTPSSGSPERNKLKVRTERPYSSLTKKSRRLDLKEGWRKSWGSSISAEDCDSTWEAFHVEYEYLLRQTLVPGSPTAAASLTSSSQVPNSIGNLQQDHFYTKLDDKLDDWFYQNDCAAISSQGHEKSSSLGKKEQANTLLIKFNERERLDDASVALVGCNVGEELRGLRRWIHDLESKLQPVVMHRRWTRSLVDLRVKEHKVIEQEIKSRSQFVSKIFNACKDSETSTHRDTAKALQRRYYELLLRSVEWQYFLEDLSTKPLHKSPDHSTSSDREWEPRAKCARYSHNNSYPDSSSSEDDFQDERLMDNSLAKTSGNVDQQVQRRMVGCRARGYSPRRRQGFIATSDESLSAESILGATLNASLTDVVDGARPPSASVVVPATNTQKFNNIGYISAYHQDTESEPDEASDEWTYTNGKLPLITKVNFEDTVQMSNNKTVICCPKNIPDAADNVNVFSLQELVEGAEVLTRYPLKSKKCVESRDASSECTSDSDTQEVLPIKKQNATRPISLSCVSELSSPHVYGSLKKKRAKHRKRGSMLRKSESSDVIPFESELPSSTFLIKSESFSEGFCRAREGSSPAVFSPQRQKPQMTSSPSTPESLTLMRGSDSESEKEAEQTIKPSFLLGPTGIVSSSPANNRKLASTDEPEPSSLNTDECWDDYQEKYPSEAYSEEPEDPKYLLEYDDDYQQYLGCNNNLDLHGGTLQRKQKRGKRGIASNIASSDLSTDTECEPDELKSLLSQSGCQLSAIQGLLSNLKVCYLIPEDLKDMKDKCSENLRCLKFYLDRLNKDSRKPLFSDVRLRELVDQWENVQSRVDLQYDMLSLKQKMLYIADDVLAMPKRFDTLDELDTRINHVKNKLHAIRDLKKQLVLVSVTVNRYISTYGEPLYLKDDIADLYGVWEEAFERVSEVLCSLQKSSRAWKELEEHLEKLQSALKADHDTLRMLDMALRDGMIPADVADSARDVAKVLSEKDTNNRYAGILSESALLLTEGSLSDSGISDSGSELELTEREKRLAALKRLARHLETVLEPGNIALRTIFERIEQAEKELRTLQQTCHDLVVRSSVKQQLSVAADTPSTKQSGKRRSRKQPGRATGGKDDNWFWRVVRSALPFHLAMVALFCVACYLEPSCCDSINNLGLTHSSNFKFFQGAPPV